MPELDEFRAIPGRGVEGRVAGRWLRLAAPDGCHGLALPEDLINTLQRAGKTAQPADSFLRGFALEPGTVLPLPAAAALPA